MIAQPPIDFAAPPNGAGDTNRDGRHDGVSDDTDAEQPPPIMPAIPQPETHDHHDETDDAPKPTPAERAKLAAKERAERAIRDAEILRGHPKSARRGYAVRVGWTNARTGRAFALLAEDEEKRRLLIAKIAALRALAQSENVNEAANAAAAAEKLIREHGLTDAELRNAKAPPSPRAAPSPKSRPKNRVRVEKKNAEPLGRIVDLSDLPEPWMSEMQWVTKTEGRGAAAVVYFVPKSCTANAITILRNDERWRGVLARNAFAETDVACKSPPWHEHDGSGALVGQWTDPDTTRLRSWLDRAYGVSLNANDLERVVGVVAESNRFHPVREYLGALKWDGVERLPTLLSVYFGSAATAYTRAIGPRWMISAVARVMCPGCQVDCTVVVEGRQGIGKSSAVRALVPDPSFYSETGVTPGEKDSYQALHGVWIYLLDELDSLKRGDVTRYKNFLTSPKDHYRESYGRRARDFYRQNVFAGTTNETEYLIDRTGNRRFWPVRVVRDIDPVTIARDRDQLWAEARVRYERGEPWHVDTRELRALCEEQQADRVQADPWTPMIATWLADPFEIIEDEDAHRRVKRHVPYDDSNGVLTGDVARYALEKPAGQITRADHMRVADVLRDLGYERGPQHTENGARVRRYIKPGAPPSPPASPHGGDASTAEVFP